LKELRKGNPSFKRSGGRKKIPDLSISNLTSAEQAWIHDQGRRFLTYGIFTLEDPEKSDMEECLIGLF